MKILPYVSQHADLTTGYVYKWTNLINGKMYIGSHCGSKRWYIGSGKAFKAAVAKYGIENFNREILYAGPNFCETEVAILRALNVRDSEQYYNLVNTATEVPRDRLTGQDKSGEKNGMYGRTHSPETKAKIAAAAAKYVKSVETRALISAQVRARPPRSEESRARTRAALIAFHTKKKESTPGLLNRGAFRNT